MSSYYLMISFDESNLEAYCSTTPEDAIYEFHQALFAVDIFHEAGPLYYCRFPMTVVQAMSKFQRVVNELEWPKECIKISQPEY